MTLTAGRALSLLAILAISVSLTAPADAAMRSCTARLKSAKGIDVTEAGAKTKALADWTRKATAAGIVAPTWRLAAERRLTCERVAAGDGKPARFECVAVGHGCMIVQNPSAAPRALPEEELAPAPVAPPPEQGANAPAGSDAIR